jgi:hypothetical protein
MVMVVYNDSTQQTTFMKLIFCVLHQIIFWNNLNNNTPLLRMKLPFAISINIRIHVDSINSYVKYKLTCALSALVHYAASKAAFEIKVQDGKKNYHFSTF